MPLKLTLYRPDPLVSTDGWVRLGSSKSRRTSTAAFGTGAPASSVTTPVISKDCRRGSGREGGAVGSVGGAVGSVGDAGVAERCSSHADAKSTIARRTTHRTPCLAILARLHVMTAVKSC